MSMIPTLQDRYGIFGGYPSHEKVAQISIAAVALCAKSVERHITVYGSMGEQRSGGLTGKYRALTCLGAFT